MSADNWTTCPKCADDADQAKTSAIAKLKKQYGKIPADDYDVKLQEILNMPDAPKRQDMREDYEIGIDGCVFEINYRAYCTHCGFTYEFKYEVEVV